MLQLGRFYEIWKHINHYRVFGSLDQPTRSIFQNILWAIGGNNRLRLSLEGNFRLNTISTFISQTLAVSFSQDLLLLYDLAKWCVVIFADKIPKRFYQIIEILLFLRNYFSGLYFPKNFSWILPACGPGQYWSGQFLVKTLSYVVFVWL